MGLARPPYRSDYERQCFPALPYLTCVNAREIDVTDISTLRTYLLSSGHIINAQRTSDRDIIGFFDQSAIREAARRYFTPRELIIRILDSRILQGGLLKRLHEDDDLRDAIDALDPEQLRDRERFRLLYAADSFPPGVSDELDPGQISAAFTSLQGPLRAEVDALRARSGQPAIRNFVFTRVRQKRADSATIYGDNVMREFVTTLDPSRLTHEELNAILTCVSGPTTTPTSGEREFRNLQAALRRESQKAHELIQRRYEPKSSDDCILRIALEMLDVGYIGGDGDVRCQLVRALSKQYDGCDELLSPGSVQDMTPLCRQVNLFGVHGKLVMGLGEEQQKRAFARLRADLRAVDLAREPEWLGAVRLQRMVELWDTGLYPPETEMSGPKVLLEMAQRGDWENAGRGRSPTSSNNWGTMRDENDTNTECGRENDEMVGIDVEDKYLSPKSCCASPTRSTVDSVSQEIEWGGQGEQESEEEEDVREEVHQPEWQQIQYISAEDEDVDEDADEDENPDEDEDKDQVEDEDEDEDEAPSVVHPPDSRSFMPVVANVQRQQVHQENTEPPKATYDPTPVKLDNARYYSASPQIHQQSPQHTQPEVMDDDETAAASHSEDEDQSEDQSDGRSQVEADAESEHDDGGPHPKQPDRAVSVVGMPESRKRRHNDSRPKTLQSSSHSPNQDILYCGRDLAVEASIVQENTSYWRQREREVEHGTIADRLPWPRPKMHHRKPTTERGGGGRRAEGQGRDNARRTHHRR